MVDLKSRLFEGYRTIGLVCDDVPFTLNRLGKERFAAVSIGHGFLVYDLEKLQVKLVSPCTMKRPISGLASFKDFTYCACEKDVLEWKRVSFRRKLLDGSQHEFGQVVSMLVFGKVLVVTTQGPEGESRGYLVAIDLGTGDVSISMRCGGAPTNRDNSVDEDDDSEVLKFTPSCIIHPSTYLNKILVGSSEGKMELWNIRTGKCIYRFAPFKSNCSIMCMENSPAIDVVGVGLGDGRIVLHNLRLDATLMEFTHVGGPVTSLTFRTDAGGPNAPPFPTMVSANGRGELAVWDLEEKRMASVIRDAHDGLITKCTFLPNEPLLVSTGVDNAIKIHIFDMAGGAARLLKSRQGHKSPPTRIRYYGGETLSTLSTGADASCCQILSAGRDRAFRMFHTARDQLNRELSQGPLLKRAKRMDVRIEELKLPPIVDFAATEARQRDWCNILSVHSGESAAFTWQLENAVIGKKVLRPDGDSGLLNLRKLRSDKVSLRAGSFPAALCVTISTCGNFGVVGTADGTVFKYNMQSGLPRGSYPKPSVAHLSKAELKALRQKRRKLDASSVFAMEGMSDLNSMEPDSTMLSSHPDRHDGPVTGIAVDALNSTLITAGQDGKVKFWDFLEHKLEATVNIKSPISQLVMNRDSGIFAVSCDDLRVLIMDITTRKVIRTFVGHTARITDMAISTDARWLATSSTDTSLRVWDLPTGRCIDWMEFPRPVTGVTFSPTGEFLATSFADSVGISLWASKAYFASAKADTIARKPVRMHIPAPGGGASGALIDNEQGPEEDQTDNENENDGNDDEVNGFYDSEELGEKIDEASSSGQLCLSGDPVSKWYALAHLELIKERNKPLEPPTKPEQAPFFLTTSKSVNPVFVAPNAADSTTKQLEETNDSAFPDMNGLAKAGDWSDDDGDDDDDNDQDEAGNEEEKDVANPFTVSSRIIKESGFSRPRSTFFTLLEEAHTKAQLIDERHGKRASYFHVVEHLKTLSPSAIDFELRSITLGPEDDEGGHLLAITMDWILTELLAGTNFELCQAMLNRLLILHDDSITEREELAKRVAALHNAQNEAWKNLHGLMQHSLCLLSHFAHQV